MRRVISPKVVLTWALAAACYLAAFRIGQIGYGSGNVSPIWPPSGLVLAVFLRFGYRYWPAFIVAELLTILFRATPALAIYHSYNALVFPLIYAGGAYALRRYLGFDTRLERERDVLALVGLAAPITAALSATLGIAGLLGAGLLPRLPLPAMWQVWWVWWIGDTVGAVVVAPVILGWDASQLRRATLPRALEAVLLAGALAGVGVGVFQFGTVPAYAVFPPLIWAALRFGPRGAGYAALLVAGLTIAYTMRGAGPFASGSVTDSLAALETFTSIVAVTALLLAAATTERETAEARVALTNSELNEALDQLRSANDAMSTRRQMTAEIAHELRNPLSTLTGYSQAMRDGSLPATPERLDAILRQAQRLERVVGDLRTLSLSDVGALSLQLEPVALAEVVRGAAETYAVEAERRGVTISTCLEGDLGEVPADLGRLSQVLGNLISNALRHTPEGGTITVSARVTDTEAVLSVADTGQGIPAEELPRVFDRYFRANGGKDVSTGSGLGLPIAKALVEAHGGTIAMDSTLGAGTIATVRLPRNGVPMTC
jgi:signal transduction histidine kinase